MDVISPAPKPFGDESFQAIPYEETQAAEPPIPIKTTSTSLSLPGKRGYGLQPLQPPNSAGIQPPSLLATAPKIDRCIRRDSGLASSSSATVRDSRTTFATDLDSTPSPKITPSLPVSSVPEGPLSNLPKTTRKWSAWKGRASDGRAQLSPSPQTSFERIATEIPTGGLDDLTTPGQIEFSKRGSMLLSGEKVNQVHGHPTSYSRKIGSRSVQNVSVLQPEFTIPTRVLSTDDELVSQKVRSMYEAGTDRDSDAPELRHARSSATADGMSTRRVRVGEKNSGQTQSVRSDRGSMIVRDENELAGGMEDWEDIDGSEVDRYGFIAPKSLLSPSSKRGTAAEHQRVQRVTTSLQVASETPRRQRSTVRRTPSAARSTNTDTPGSASTRSVRPASRNSQSGSLGGVPSKLAQWLPYNKGRRIMDEAADMLTLPPGLADIAEDVCIQAAEEARRKEWEREDKWTKMAKVVNTRRDGGGMTFEFDTSSAKLIDRTWKGIPDRWRATAWRAFLTASAKKRASSPTDEELMMTFHRLVEQSSADDFQIDIDVPRTINKHIMFRRRYRGGQRALFRVLHCLSIYFPDTGYVQGMAALAATLLCYYDEEMAFVMLVRLWQLRGLEQLYQSGFEGLMRALEEFETDWLGGKEIATKLVGFFSAKAAAMYHLFPDFLAPVLFLFFSSSFSFSPQKANHPPLPHPENPQHLPNRIRHKMVPDSIQLFHSLPRAASHLGRLHAPRGSHLPFFFFFFLFLSLPYPSLRLSLRPPILQLQWRSRRAARRLRGPHRRHARYHPSAGRCGR